MFYLVLLSVLWVGIILLYKWLKNSGHSKHIRMFNYFIAILTLFAYIISKQSDFFCDLVLNLADMVSLLGVLSVTCDYLSELKIKNNT